MSLVPCMMGSLQMVLSRAVRGLVYALKGGHARENGWKENTGILLALVQASGDGGLGWEGRSGN